MAKEHCQQRQEVSEEARKSAISEEELAIGSLRTEEWAIEKLVARELERPKLANDEASRMIWPHHREAAEQLARE